MVGRFGLGNKSPPAKESTVAEPSPPPPYKEENEHGSQVLLAETTTTTTTSVVTTTTQTTTHFFSLPLWRRRGTSHPNPAAQPSLSAANGDEHELKASGSTQSSMRFEKDLPPVPVPRKKRIDASDSSGRTTPETPQQRDMQFASHQTASPSSLTGHSTAKLKRKSSRPSTANSAVQSTYALAQASLGLGLPHVLPQASASSSSVDLSATPPETPDEQAVRKRQDRRRTRGVSMGPNTLFNFAPDPKGKGKEKEQTLDVPTPSPKSLLRRSSFFGRRKDGPERNPSPTRASTVVPPVPTPLSIDTVAASRPMPESQMNTARPGKLVRRHSDRTTLSPPATADIITTPPSPSSPRARRRPRRPSTADSGRMRSKSFLDPGSLAPEPTPPLPLSLLHGAHSADSTVHGSSPRNRASTNPPLLHRLSMNFFSSSSTSMNTDSVLGHPITSSPVSSASPSPRPSIHKQPTEIPKPRTDEESPEHYLERLMEAVSKAEIATVLASSGDQFQGRALQAYIGKFNFSSDPLDVALRKLLMDVGLPKETQQIDRVIEAFASRYKECNPDLFTSDDHAYILAFSLIMLHTDFFNKSNKRKMTKPDYVKNTRLPGVAPEILDCFYDNIVFAPFIFIEDPVDVNGQKGFTSDGPSRMSTLTNHSPNPGNGSTTNLLGRTKIDPYYLITRNLLGPLHINVEQFVPLENPFAYEGTTGPWDPEELRLAFAKADVVEINTGDNRRASSSAIFAVSVGGASSPILSPVESGPDLGTTSQRILSIKITKIGVLNRKDDTVEGGKKAMSRKWKCWSVVLTGSQLLLFRDTSWAAELAAQLELSYGRITGNDMMLRPDEHISLKDTITVFDRSYRRHANTLRFIISDGRQLLLQAPDEKELNEWISRINYASAFKSAGLRMRGTGPSEKEVELAGAAAASSHLKDMDRLRLPASAHSVASDSSGAASLDGAVRRASDADMRRNKSADLPRSFQSSATFDEVKSILAADRIEALDAAPPPPSSFSSAGRARAHSLASSIRSPVTSESGQSDFPSRSQIIQSKVRHLDAKIAATQTQLDTDMRFVRNVAVMTPFQRSTRERLQTAVQNISKRIMQVRLEMEKLTCHRTVLSDDLNAAERSRQENRDIALRAAREVIDNNRDTPTSEVDPPDEDVERFEVEGRSSPQPIPRSETIRIRPPSSVRESFYSAVDFTPDSYSSTSAGDSTRPPSTYLDPNLVSESPTAPPLASSVAGSSAGSLRLQDSETPEAEDSPRMSNSQSVDQPPSSSMEGEERPSEEVFYTASEAPQEEAEEWNKTKAAKRVSLVKLPSDLRISMLFGKNRQPSEGQQSTFQRRRPSVLQDSSGLPYTLLDI